MKLDKEAIKLLEHLKSTANTSSRIYRFSEYDELAQALNTTEYDISETVSYLLKTGYLSYQKANGKNIGFRLSHQGVNYKEMRKNEKIDFFCKSILAPIAVSLFVNLLIFIIRILTI